MLNFIENMDDLRGEGVRNAKQTGSVRLHRVNNNITTTLLFSTPYQIVLQQRFNLKQESVIYRREWGGGGGGEARIALFDHN